MKNAKNKERYNNLTVHSLINNVFILAVVILDWGILWEPKDLTALAYEKIYK